jgi:hypothetical protein
MLVPGRSSSKAGHGARKTGSGCFALSGFTYLARSKRVLVQAGLLQAGLLQAGLLQACLAGFAPRLGLL